MCPIPGMHYISPFFDQYSCLLKDQKWARYALRAVQTCGGVDTTQFLKEYIIHYLPILDAFFFLLSYVFGVNRIWNSLKKLFLSVTAGPMGLGL